MAFIQNKKNKPSSGSRVAALVILCLILVTVAGYFLVTFHKTIVTPQKAVIIKDKPTNLLTLPQKENQNKLATVKPDSNKNKISPSSNPAPPKIEKPMILSSKAPRLAIIIDDMGSSLSQAKQLAAINLPLTFSIIPGLRFDKDVAVYSAAQKIETMIHIPMQSKGWPRLRLESNGLLVSMNSDEIAKRVSDFVQRFPTAIGVNNHMGSEFTEQEDKMEVVLKTLKQSDLFYVDSVTSPATAGLKTAERLGIKSARRDVFLDNEQDRHYILGQLNQAVKLARKKGSAIAICHPHSATISALTALLPDLASQGVQLVFVSELVH